MVTTIHHRSNTSIIACCSLGAVESLVKVTSIRRQLANELDRDVQTKSFHLKVPFVVVARHLFTTSGSPGTITPPPSGWPHLSLYHALQRHLS